MKTEDGITLTPEQVEDLIFTDFELYLIFEYGSLHEAFDYLNICLSDGGLIKERTLEAFFEVIESQVQRQHNDC